MKKTTLLIALLIIASYVTFEILHFIFRFELNRNNQNDIYSCIFSDPSYVKVDLPGFRDNSEITATYVSNARQASACLSPQFPAIELKFNSDVAVSWLQFIYTDSILENSRAFVDTVAEGEPYPFYTHGNKLYDAPLWPSGFLVRPLSRWEARSYVVKVDLEKRLLCPLGGTRWGFTFSLPNIFPEFIVPNALNKKDFLADLKRFSQKFSAYKVYVDDCGF